MKYFTKLAFPPKTNLERIMSHYQVSLEEAIGMLKKKPIEELLPERQFLRRNIN